MAFVKFTETGRSFSPKASLNPRGYLSFSDGARRRFEMDKYTHAILYFDKETNKIGVELTNDHASDGAIKLRLRKTGGATLGAKSFVEFFGLHIQKTTVYDVIPGESPQWVLIDLQTARERNTKDDIEDEEEGNTP